MVYDSVFGFRPSGYKHFFTHPTQQAGYPDSVATAKFAVLGLGHSSLL